jgi:hypothetical protein
LQQIAADRDWWSADPGSTTANWRIGYAASPQNADSRIRRKSCSISPGATSCIQAFRHDPGQPIFNLFFFFFF